MRTGAVVPPGAEEYPVRGQLAGNSGEGGEKVGVPLVRDQIGEGRQNERRRSDTETGPDLAGGREAGESVQVDPVVDEPETRTRHALGGQFGDDGPGVAQCGGDAPVQPPLQPGEDRMLPLVAVQVASTHHDRLVPGQQRRRPANEVGGRQKEVHHVRTALTDQSPELHGGERQEEGITDPSGERA